MTIQTGKINSSSIHAVDSNRSMKRLGRAANWYFPPLINRILPEAFSDKLRQLRGSILAHYLMRQLPRDRQFEQSQEDALASASLSIIVPILDAPEVTKRCLRSLQQYAPKAEVILVDDGSKLEETKYVLEEHAKHNGWKLTRHLQPLGHSAACDAGVSLATRPYLCLLNSDTVVTPWCWRLITQAFEDDPNIGVIGPSTSHAGNEQTIPLANFTRHYLNDSQICEYALLLLSDSSNTFLLDIPWVSGFAFFIRHGIWKQLGGFDRSLPDYGNETELCKRVLQSGYRVVWARTAYIHHLGAVSYSKKIGVESILARKRSADDYIQQKHRS